MLHTTTTITFSSLLGGGVGHGQRLTTCGKCGEADVVWLTLTQMGHSHPEDGTKRPTGLIISRTEAHPGDAKLPRSPQLEGPMTDGRMM